MHIDVSPVVTDQFDGRWRYYSAKHSLTITEPIQRVAHRLPQLQISQPRTEPLPTFDLSNNYLPRHSPYFANYLNPITKQVQHMNHNRTIKDPVPERQAVRISLDQFRSLFSLALAIIERETSRPPTLNPELLE